MKVLLYAVFKDHEVTLGSSVYAEPVEAFPQS